MSMCIVMSDDEKMMFLQEHAGLVHSLAQKFENKGIEKDDLVQEVTIGFLKAMDRFDPSRGTKLTTFAVEVATNEILQIIRKNGAKQRQAIIVSLDMGLDDEGMERDSLLNQDLSFTDSLHTAAPDMDTQMYNKQILDAAKDILANEMDRESRVAVILSAKGYSQEQIAKKLGTSQSKISKVIKLATCELRLKLQARGIL